MSEQNMRQVLIDLLRPLHALSVENSVNPGTPDMNYVEGWIELKERDTWGIKDVPVLIEHFTPQQRIFMRQRWQAGGHCYLMLKVKQEWLLFDGLVAHGEVGFATKQVLLSKALHHWKARPTQKELIACLTGKRAKSKL